MAHRGRRRARSDPHTSRAGWAEARRIASRLWGGTLRFIRWFDEIYGRRATTATFDALLAAARAGVADVPERPDDPNRSFLEATLEEAIARHLPGQTERVQQSRRFELPGFEPYPYGVDIDWRHDGVHAGIEAKVWDVLHSLFDVLKVATAIYHRRLDEAFCAVAALDGHWAATNPFTAMTAAPTGAWKIWDVEQLVATPTASKAVLVASGPRPFEVPAQIETMAAEPIAMRNAALHSLRLLAVRPAADTKLVRLPARDV